MKRLGLALLLIFVAGMPVWASSLVVISSTAFVAAPPATPGGPLTAVQTLPPGTTGYAYDPTTGARFAAGDFGYSLNGLYPGTSGSLLDMAIGGGFLWAAMSTGTGGVSLAQIDPTTMDVVEHDLGTDTVTATDNMGNPVSVTIPFLASGVAWDGGGLWISNNYFSADGLANGIYGTSIQRFTFAGGVLTPTATSFRLWPDTWTWDPIGGVSLSNADGRAVGGLAWNATTSSLLVGTDRGEIWSVNTGTGAKSLFATSDGGFVQGLEFVPEPATYMLMGLALLSLPLVRRKKS